MKDKYGGQAQHELGQGVKVHHQDQPIGGALGGAMEKKYGDQGHHELGQGVKVHH